MQKELREASISWFAPGKSDANPTEILWFALLLAKSADSAGELKEWAKKVNAFEYNRAIEMKAAWQPLAEGENAFPLANRSSTLFTPMHDAYYGTWDSDDLDKIGLAMQAWDGDGSFDSLRAMRLRKHLGKKGEQNAPGIPRSKKDTRPTPRCKTWSIVEVARLIFRRGPALRAALDLDGAHSDRTISLFPLPCTRTDLWRLPPPLPSQFLRRQCRPTLPLTLPLPASPREAWG